MARNRRPSFHSTRFADLIANAGREIALGIERATVVTDHHPTSGGIREEGIRDFLRKLLPDRFYVGTGFAFDARDTQTRQTDIIIALDPPLSRVFERDRICYLPCEVVLAVIEVKKTLRSSEITDVLANATAFRALQPYGTQVFGSAQRRGKSLDSGTHRCFYSAVALASDFPVNDWAQREWDRLKTSATKLDTTVETVDRLVILDRGIINSTDERYQSSLQNLDACVFEWFIHLSNHLDREARRRPPFDPDIYSKGQRWTRL